jgi:hypothetical protein
LTRRGAPPSSGSRPPTASRSTRSSLTRDSLLQPHATQLRAWPQVRFEIANETRNDAGAARSELAASIGSEADDRARQRDLCRSRAASSIPNRGSSHAIPGVARQRCLRARSVRPI